MSYRRDAIPDEQIPLPFETVYNSEADAVKSEDFLGRALIWSKNRVHANRLEFTYPPEWKTSNVGEKIIGIRNMTIHRKEGTLQFILYIRKYKRSLIRVSANDKLNQERINAIDDERLRANMRIFAIPIVVRVTRYDTWLDIKERIMNVIRQENIYNFLCRKLKSLYTVPVELIPKMNQLEQVKNNYYEMIQLSDELILERIPFYLEPDDVDLITTVFNNKVSLCFISPYNSNQNSTYCFDFTITAFDQFTDDIHVTYRKFYVVNDDGELTGKTKDVPDPFTAEDWFNSYTSDFFAIYCDDDFRYTRTLRFNNVMTDLQCEVAASFAVQSNHNIIGRTNEVYTPIKYYKVNDNNDRFYIEFYDRDNVNLPLTFNDNLVFTIDMVLLQNRKLIYS
ncbi:hypothetical protein M9Y10_005959 [Tritrichomonas musculus]|uniref:Uncharacterized protein n=1 Tax=Tritrichomonas musculus TaxID=1915356 RepID=A0ABR2JD76_9EUKA